MGIQPDFSTGFTDGLFHRVFRWALPMGLPPGFSDGVFQWGFPPDFSDGDFLRVLPIKFSSWVFPVEFFRWVICMIF